MHKPLISVLILSYNHGNFIKTALNSVVSNCSDEYDLEIILIDDGSVDGSINTLREFKNSSPIPFMLIEKNHEGVGAIARNFNELISLAQGKYISFLASDDSYRENRFAAQLSLMEEDERLVLCYANGVHIKKGMGIGPVHPKRETRLLKSESAKEVHNYVTTNVPQLFIQSILVRTNFIQSMKAFDDDLIADDWVFNIRVFHEIFRQNLMFKFVDEIVFNRNIHNENTSRDVRLHFERVAQVVERYCEDKIELLGKAALAAILESVIKKDCDHLHYYFKHLRISGKLPFIILSWIGSMISSRLAKLFACDQRFN